MTDKQPEALRLADDLEDAALMTGLSHRDHLDHRIDAAAELRRLHAENVELLRALQDIEAAPCADARSVVIARAAILKATKESA